MLMNENKNAFEFSDDILFKVWLLCNIFIFNSPCNQFVLLLRSPASLEGLVFLVLPSGPSGPLNDKYYRRYVICDMKNDWKTKKSPQWILFGVKGKQIFRTINYLYAINLICDIDPVWMKMFFLPLKHKMFFRSLFRSSSGFTHTCSCSTCASVNKANMRQNKY